MIFLQEYTAKNRYFHSKKLSEKQYRNRINRTIILKEFLAKVVLSKKDIVFVSIINYQT
jgi:hypothetical protein